MGCRSLETIKLPNKVTSIEAMAFFGCNSLDSVYCMADPDILTWGASDNDFKPDKGTTCYVAGKYKSTYESKFSNVNVAFDSYVIGQGTCGDDLTWIIDGDGTLTVSGTGAMYDFDYDTQPWAPYKEDILRVIIEDGATSIGSYAFYGYNNLSFVGMNDSVTSIGYNAFGETADLKNIALSAGLQTIGYGAFYKSGIESILIPASVTSIGNYTFEFSGLKTVTFESGSRLTELNKTLFHGCSQLESVTLPDSLEIIGEEAFRECAALKTITIPGTVSTIKKQAFYNCTGLESVIFEDGVGEICEKAFSFCMNIKSLTIPGSVVFKGKEAFSHCLGLESLTICDGITTIPNSTFFNCRHLVSISLADSVTAIGNDAFSVYYDAYAHSYDSLYGALETIVLPSNLTDLGSYALCGQGLRTITIPGSVRVVSDNLYEGCIYLNTITLLKGITSITNYAGFNCNAVTSASVPSTVTYIGKYAFGSGDSMEDLYLYPDPANLSSFYYYESTDTDNDKGNINSNTKIHVLNQYLEAYRTKYQDIAGQFVGDLDPNGEGTINTGTGVHLYGYNLSLSGDVSVNFWFKLSDGYEDDTNYIKFTVNGREQIVTVGEADDGTGGAKVFRCGVTAVEMTDKITAQFYLADGTAVGSSYSYTVRDYANYILTHDSYSAKAKNLVKAMLNYGACSQKYFNYNTNALANSVLDAADQQVPILNYTDLMYKDIPSRSIRPALVSLVLESEISLKLYFNTADVEGMEFKQYFYPITVTTQGSYTVVTIQNISALWINSGVRVDVWKDGAYYDYVEYCPGKYCKLILKQPTSEVYNDDLKRVVSALCIYHSAAMDFAQA